jgi:hypothetical protein
MKRRSTRALKLALALCVYPVLANSAVRAAIVAADSASDASYGAEAGGAWKGVSPSVGENAPGPDDGGFGFQPWIFSGGYHYPADSPYGTLNHFIDGVDFAPSTFNQLGAPSFGLTNANFAFGGSTARATRVFTAPLIAGSSVRLDFDNPTLRPFDIFAPSSYVIRLNSGGGPVTQAGVTERFGLFATFGYNGGNWSTTDSSGLTDLGLASAQTTNGATFRFTLTGEESYSLEIQPLGGGAPLAVATGQLAGLGGGAIDSLEFMMFENGSGNGISGPASAPTGEREFFFNNLVVDDGFDGDADYDGDDDVDGADFLLWQRTLGSRTELAADGDQNGVVDAGDLALWKRRFGVPVAAVNAHTIPEPAAIVTALGAALALFRRRLRPRGRALRRASPDRACRDSGRIARRN